jgi:hypothetical protein
MGLLSQMWHIWLLAAGCACAGSMGGPTQICPHRQQDAAVPQQLMLEARQAGGMLLCFSPVAHSTMPLLRLL